MMRDRYAEEQEAKGYPIATYGPHQLAVLAALLAFEFLILQIPYAVLFMIYLPLSLIDRMITTWAKIAAGQGGLP